MKLKIQETIILKEINSKLDSFLENMFFSKYDDFLILFDSSNMFILKLENKEVVFSTYGVFNDIYSYVIDEEKEYVFFIGINLNTDDSSLYAYGIYDKILYSLNTSKHTQFKEFFSFVIDFEKKEITTSIGEQFFTTYQKYSYFLNKEKEEIEFTFISDVNYHYIPKWKELDKSYAIEKNKNLIGRYSEYANSKDNKLFAVSLREPNDYTDTDEDQIIAIVYNLETNSLVNYLRHESYYQIEDVEGRKVSFMYNSKYLVVLGIGKYTLYIFDIKNGGLVSKFKNCTTFDVSNDSKLLAYTSDDNNKPNLIIAEIII